MDDREYTREELASLLAFYADSGLDFPIGDANADRFDAPKPEKKDTPTAPTASSATNSAPRQPTPQQQSKAVPDDEAIRLAETAAAAARTLEELYAAVHSFDACALKRTARTTVFESGARGASLMVIMQAPTREDDGAGAGFQGPSGILLQAMLNAIGLDRDRDCYGGYCVPWRTPGDQPPNPRHMAIYRPFLDRQIELAKPKMILSMVGDGAARFLFQSNKGLVGLRGEVRNLKGVRAVVTFAPSFLLNEPLQKRNAWSDLKMLRTALDRVN